MQYLGGKRQLARHITAILNQRLRPGQAYVEPFVGGANITWLVEGRGRRIAADICPDLIMMWRALQDGWEPPGVVSPEDYKSQRHAPSSALRAFVMFGCSFGGKWAGGYARNNRKYDYAGAARRGVLRQIARMHDVDFLSGDYRELSIPPGALVYCDPPYEGTTGYNAAGRFDHAAFWVWARGLARAGCDVIVSEFEAPADFRELAAFPRLPPLHGPAKAIRIDRLFILR